MDSVNKNSDTRGATDWVTGGWGTACRLQVWRTFHSVCISPDGLQATVTEASNHAMALVAGSRCGVGNGVGSRGGAAVTSSVIAGEHEASSVIAGEHEASPLSLSASFTVEALDAETFIGVVVNSTTTDFDVWVKAKGSFGYGSKGLKGSEDGYSSFGTAWSVVRFDLPCAHSRIALLLSRSTR